MMDIPRYSLIVNRSCRTLFARYRLIVRLTAESTMKVSTTLHAVKPFRDLQLKTLEGDDDYCLYRPDDSQYLVNIEEALRDFRKEFDRLEQSNRHHLHSDELGRLQRAIDALELVQNKVETPTEQITPSKQENNFQLFQHRGIEKEPSLNSHLYIRDPLTGIYLCTASNRCFYPDEFEAEQGYFRRLKPVGDVLYALQKDQGNWKSSSRRYQLIAKLLEQPTTQHKETTMFDKPIMETPTIVFGNEISTYTLSGAVKALQEIKSQRSTLDGLPESKKFTQMKKDLDKAEKTLLAHIDTL